MFASFLNLVYPKICIHCHHSLARGESDLCSHCLGRLPLNEKLSDHEELRQEIVSSHLFRHLFYFLKFYKGGITQSVLHQIKYEGNTELARSVGRWYGFKLQTEGYQQQFDLIVPVPLHFKKLRIRGYNQSEFIALGLMESVKAKTDFNFLTRTVNNPTQTRKSRVERHENVDHVFTVRDNRYPKSTRILLIDDVVTTGATLESCATVLMDRGFDQISFAAVAFAKK